MAKRILIYLTIVFFSICFFILYIDLFSLIILVIAIAYPFAMLALLVIVRKNTNVNLISKNIVSAKGSDIDIKVTIDNKSHFPIPNAILNIEYKSTFENITDKLTAIIPIQARNQQEVNFRLSSKYCGKVEIGLNNITIMDYLKLFSIKIIPVQPVVSIIVTPDCHPIDACLSNSISENQENDVFSKTRGGDDPSEVFNINEYREGDKINRIHWKLSAKANSPMVKEYSHPITNSTLIIFDLCCGETSDNIIATLDTLMETLLSISFFLVENGAIHTVAWYNQLSEGLEIEIINNEDDIFKLLGNIFNTNSYLSQPHTLIKYANSGSTHQFAHAIHLTAYSNPDFMHIFSDIENCLKLSLLLIEEKDSSTINNHLDIDTVNIGIGKVRQCLAEFVI